MVKTKSSKNSKTLNYSEMVKKVNFNFDKKLKNAITRRMFNLKI